MNAKQAKAIAYILLSFPVIIINKVIVSVMLFITHMMLHWIIEPLMNSRKRIMMDGIRIMSEAVESKRKE